MLSIITMFCAPKARRQTRTTRPERFFVEECKSIINKSQTKPKTNLNSLTALRSFLLFYGSDDVPLSSITASRMRQYEQWLWNRGVSRNTSASYMRSLRALYNKVSGRRSRQNPFQDVVTACQRTRRRAVPLLYISAIAKYQTDNPRLQISRDMFLFSFYCMGMPFVDIAHLRWNQIDGDTLSYQRRKTGVEVVMHLEPEAVEIIRRYKGSSRRFVFPLLTSDDELEYRHALNNHNQRLKNIEQELGLDLHISSYVSRHTWASYAYKESGDINLVASAIGHTNTVITRTYIKPLSGGKTANVNKRLLRKIKKRTYFR